ncbi:MBL fold metallo-hydrolase [Chitinophaga caeni]|uniref:MBL fold metallo-hydrolase n=1 Tax=Chitinophaga caeni TaxID=2029983 RepID=A0A291QT28_9BACT|nr:MBL fold metallo-hydrolase [Chitinophaga caeni]ATL47061.1 MBL fold metallo-hydrolase [Chitinophaga caeni]
MRIIPLSEGSFTVDASKKFVPFDTTQDQLESRNTGSLLVEIQPFLVITDHDFILFDAGLGHKNKDGVLQLHQNLVNEGINPMEITKVMMSHLHKDHAGGMSLVDDISGKRELSFPSATYYVNKKEMDYAIEQDGKSYLKEEVDILLQKDNVVFLDDKGTVDGYIQYEVTGGHCPYHQVFLVDDGTDKIFFGGDVAPQIGQLKRRFIAKYDFDGRKSMELRAEYLEKGKEEDWTFLFYHDIKTPYTKIWK